VIQNELRKSNITYKIVDNNGYANIIIKNNNKLPKNGRYSVTNSVRGFAKPVGRVAGLITAIDILDTLFDGHAQVSLAKSAVIASEYIISAYVPGGIILVLGFEVLDANIHLTDSLYKSIDPTYE